MDENILRLEPKDYEEHVIRNIMYKIVVTALLYALSLPSFGQNDKNHHSIANAIRINFNYDSLSSLSCINTPSGIYAIKFTVDGNNHLFDFKSSNDSLTNLNLMFIEAIKKSFSSTDSKILKKGHYIQLICFTNILHCNLFRDKKNILQTVSPDTLKLLNTNYNKEIIDILSSQLVSLESSIISLQFQEVEKGKLVYLPMALINNVNPNSDKSSPGFKNDVKLNTLTNDQIKVIEKLVEERKKGKTKN